MSAVAKLGSTNLRRRRFDLGQRCVHLNSFISMDLKRKKDTMYEYFKLMNITIQAECDVASVDISKPFLANSSAFRAQCPSLVHWNVAQQRSTPLS